MIGAFPETRLIIGCVYRSVGTNAPIPFSVFVIYQMLLDILPTARCFLKSHFIIEMLIKINVPHHVFGLHPPMAIPVCSAFVGESLVNHAALGRQSFIGCGRNVLHQRLLSPTALYLPRLKPPHESARNLNVMPIGYDTVFGHPIIIKKELQMSGLLVQYLICEKLYQVTKLLLKNGVFPHAIEICVRLKMCKWVFMVLRSFSSLSLRRISEISFQSRVNASQ